MRFLGQFLMWIGILKPAVMCSQDGVEYMERVCHGYYRCRKCGNIYHYPRGRYR